MVVGWEVIQGMGRRKRQIIIIVDHDLIVVVMVVRVKVWVNNL